MYTVESCAEAKYVYNILLPPFFFVLSNKMLESGLTTFAKTVPVSDILEYYMSELMLSNCFFYSYHNWLTC